MEVWRPCLIDSLVSVGGEEHAVNYQLLVAKEANSLLLILKYVR